MQVDLIHKNAVNFFINYSNYNHKENNKTTTNIKK